MGLLDSLYNSDNYGGQGGGLLDLLKQFQMQQQYQPSAGFPDQTPPQPQQAQPIAVGDNYMMQRVGTPQDFEPQAPTDISAQSRQPNGGAMNANAQMMPQPDQPLPPALGGVGSILGRIGNPDGLIARLTGNDSRSIAQQNLKAQYDAMRQALQQNGDDPQVAASKAMVAVMNPEAAKTIIPELFTNKQKFQKTGVDGLGRETYGFINERDQTVNGKPIGAADGGTQPSDGLGDMNKSGEAYLKSLPKQVQGTVRGMLDGTIQPPSSFAAAKPYWQGMIAAAKNADPGFDENKWASRHKMSTDVAASGNSSMGGILSNGKSAFKHLAEYTESAADLGNTSHNFPLGGAIAHAQNYIGNTLGGSDTNAKIKAINDNLGHYGQESTKFYAGTGGGVEERMNALKEMNPNTTSSQEMAAYAAKEKGLMLDRMREKEAQIRDVMGEAYLQAHPVFTDALKADIARIDANIAKLTGGGAAPSSSAFPSGWSVKVR